MRALSIAIGLCWFSLATFAQTEFGSLAGLVSKTDQAPLANIPVEAKSVTTGKIYKAATSPKGQYKFGQLPAGTYEVSVLMLLYRPFVRKDLAVTAGQAAHLDIQLSDDAFGNTLGEFPALIELFSKKPPPSSGPAPKMADGKPDFSGVWTTPPASLFSVLQQQPELQPWAEALVRERLLNQIKDKPSARCWPDGEPFVGLFPVKIVQTHSVLVSLVEDVIAAHQVFLDGRGHPNDLEPSWLGHSTGKWDGDTLVIDTVGFNDKTWLFVVVPHTEMLHLTIRLRRPDLGHLQIETTYDDPGTFLKPVTTKAVDVLAPDEEIGEVLCENNQYTEHVSGK